MSDHTKADRREPQATGARSRHMKQVRPLWAGVRSLLVPGWGQVVAGRRASGWVLIVASLVVLITAVGLMVVLGPVEVVSRLADPDLLVALGIANALVAVVRLASVEHAWWTSGGRRLPIALGLAVAVSLPHVAAGMVGNDLRTTMLEVFASDHQTSPASGQPTSLRTPVTSTTTVTYPTTTGTPPTTTVTYPTTTGTHPATTGTPPTTTGTPADPPDRLLLGRERVNILLLGGDAGPGRWGLRTDTVMVASVNTLTGHTALFGLPRNFGSLTFTDGTVFPGRILNEVYSWGKERPEIFPGPDPGAAAVADVAEVLTGLEVDYFMLVDLTGFADVVDAFGGVSISVPRQVEAPLFDTETGGYEMVVIGAGSQHLDGDHALAYVRARHDSSDYDRMGRQRCLLSALADHAEPLSLLANLGDLLGAIETHIDTDLPLADLPDMIRLAARVDTSDIRVLGFGPEWGLGRNADGYTIPDVERIRNAVAETIAHPDVTGPAPTAADVCG